METITSLKVWIIGGILALIAGFGHHIIDNVFFLIDPLVNTGNSDSELVEDYEEPFYDDYEEEMPQNRQYEY